MKNKNFTMVDNHIIDTLTLKELGVYIMVKKHAGAQGESWVSNRTLAKKLELSHNTISKIYKELIKKGLLACVGKKKVKTSGGEQEVSVYRCVCTGVPSSLRCVPKVVQGVSVESPNKIPINKIVEIELTQEERQQKLREIRQSLCTKVTCV